jgi:hypothetical protein
VGILRQLDGAGKRSRVVGLVVSGMLVAGTSAALVAAVPAASATEPPMKERSPQRPGSLADFVVGLLQGDLPLLVEPATTTTTTTAVAPPEKAVADAAPEIEVPEVQVTLPVTPPTVAPPTVTPPPIAPPSTVPSAAPQFANTQVGVASWYNDRGGRCAHRNAPIGTVVNVTNLASGATVQCTVTNRGPYVGGRVIDLSDESFAEIAPLSQGLADVRVEW